jgi:hypothetical protein
MVTAYNLKLSSTPFAESLMLPPPQIPPIPFKADETTLLNIKKQFLGYYPSI